jgi:deazaflavin-dependent oxidoreductase (nitroreductase family)
MSDMPDLFGQEHIDAYLETDGERGHDWIHGTHALILTTTGRKSGEERMAPLIYGMAGERDAMIVASKGGAPEHPAWYLNLRDKPDVQVQIRGDRFDARARDATPEERPELWKRMAEIWPPYDEYQQKTDREIPIVILERE